MSWSKSLIKLATYEVETLQKRLAEIRDRRTAAELKLVMLEAQGQAELANGAGDPMAGLYRTTFLEALRARKIEAQSELDAILVEELGARDALGEAFETQKKYEQVSEAARRVEAKEQARRETAALDELGLRKLAR